MKIKRKTLFMILIVLVFGLGICVDKLLFTNNDIDDGLSDSSQVKHEHMLSMMLETDSGSGEYTLEERSSWPTKEDGYIFNSTLSKCENGSELRWDEEKNAVYVQTNVSDKCYVYFDVFMPSLISDVCNSENNLAGCIKTLYQKSNSDLTSIYYHDINLVNGANDNSYRYAGASDTTNNFVCFGSDSSTCPDDNLYRIIGVFGDQVKLIKWDYATSTLLGTDGDYNGTYPASWGTSKGTNAQTAVGAYYWNKVNYSTAYNATNKYNVWSYSELNKTNLNKNYLNNIGTEWANKIATTTWKVGGNTSENIMESNAQTAYTNEYANPAETTTETAKIGLMYVSDYYYGASPTYWTYPGYNSSDSSKGYSAAIGENWMYMGLYEWTVVRRLSGYVENYSFNLESNGDVRDEMVNSDAFAVRPVFYLNSYVTYVSGDGSKNNPIRIN